MNGGLIFGAILKMNGTSGVTQRQMRYLQHAARAAKLSNCRIRVGAVAVCGKQALSVGWNATKSHPLQATFDRFRNFRAGSEPPHSIHAEIMCLSPIFDSPDVDWSRVTLYVCRLRNDRPYGMARPCPACMAAIQSLGIKHIIYTTNDGFAAENLMKAS